MMADSSRSSSGAPSYRSTQSDDYVTVGRETLEKSEKSRSYGKRALREQVDATEYRPPPFPPPAQAVKVEEHTSLWQRYRKAIAILQYVTILFCIGVVLAVPVVLYHEDAYGSDWDDDEQNNTKYYIFLFLLIGWTSGSLANLFANILPYLFRWVAKYVSLSLRGSGSLANRLGTSIKGTGSTGGSFAS